ncbi:rho GTPase-activating protein SYDE2 isoform X2 [Electrophorus electricus]|uniref:rho GTPase-activating protein SYDE2 isoform X2 n=1 Tax=Electrophorus electricus TaxID=8005 RepID=UPI0015D0BB57|nr:rho GTPase-activating protein SYDE2 isoform X2 [Electrophorus electricus]
MADPLRRTLFAKLRGKRPKKGTPAEGKEVVSQAGAAQALRAVPSAERDCASAASRGKRSGFNGGVHSPPGRLGGRGAAVSGGASPRREASMRVNTGAPSLGGPDNETRSGVSVQSEVPDGRSDRGDVKRFHRQEVCLSKPGPLPRRHARGDCIGFGSGASARFEHGGAVKAADGREPCLESSGTGERAALGYDAASFIPRDVSRFNCTGDQLPESGVTAGGTRTHNCGRPRVFHYIGRNGDESDLIRTVESSLELCRDFRMPALQSPTFFPTELEVVRADVTSLLASSRDRHHSVDSEDDDYYDNEILPFYECGTRNPEPDEPAETSSQSRSDRDATRETDRLRNRLKEALYLLMNAMHDMELDGRSSSSGCAEQSGSSSQSRDSVTWPADSDVPPASGRGCRGVGGVSRRSRSLQSLAPSQGRGILQRSASDGGVRYPAECNGGGAHSGKGSDHAPGAVAPDAGGPASDGQPRFKDAATAEAAVPVPEHVCEEKTHLCGPPALPGIMAVKAAPRCRELPNQSAGAGVGRPPGVTVNKLQEWMHRGRVLSSEMRQRIAGSSARGVEGQVWAGRPSHVCAPRGDKPGSMGPAGAPQPALSDSSSATCRDPCCRPVPLNSITVSKKRNWLHQSSTRPSLPSDDASPLRLTVAEDDRGPSPDPPTPRQPRVRPGARPVRGSPLPVDPTEENDADDEGEIWYNPIPEDEEAELSQGGPAPRPAEACGEGGGAECSGDAVSGITVHSGEQGHLSRQTCRTQEELLPAQPAATEVCEPSVGGSACSLNPAKKTCSISWSLPERIRSPRTVRKLSMKMKKLPELSRKLSVKGNPAPASSGQSESRACPVRADSTPKLSPGSAALASGNVIWRYHLDSSVCTQKGAVAVVPKSASKGGYLSDGDSPELVAKSSKHSDPRDREAAPGPRAPGWDLDIDAFRPYSFSEQARCTAYLSGLMSVHLCGAEGLRPRRGDSRDVYCAIQVDSVNKARTALLACRTAFLDMDHNFNIELENAQHLKLAVFSWEAEPQRRSRVCCHGTVALPPLFRPAGSRAQRLAVRLEPRGVIYVRLGLMERWANSLDAPDGEGSREARVFGADPASVVEREGVGLSVPLLIQKCIDEIERRGCQVVGLYRLCGSAAAKKGLREAFERNSCAVQLSETNYPDINVITGVLKDYLRELPSPLISKPLYEAVLDTMSTRPLLIGCGGCENDPADSDHTVGLLDALPHVDKATLWKLLDHLKRVASHHEVNKMTCQNLAVCFGPVLLRQRQDAAGLANRVFIDSEELASALHFKKHIEVLHYLLQLWPVVDAQTKPPSPILEPRADPPAAAPVRRRKERPQVLNLDDGDLAGVLRPRPGRLDSPSNRYAGDWSACRDAYLQPGRPEEADYDDVPEEPPAGHQETASEGGVSQGGGRASELEAATADNDVMDVEAEAELKLEAEPESSGEQSEEDRGVVQLQRDVAAAIVPVCRDRVRSERDERAYQAYMKISHRVNLRDLRDLQDSIDTLIGNLERELNKNKLTVGYGLSH